MRRLLLILLSLVFAAGTALAQQPEPPSRPEKKDTGQSGAAESDHANTPAVQSIGASGSIFVKENQWDFGHVTQDSKVTHRFLVQNVGDDTLFIQKIKPT